jgi:uncharacterized membrane protein
MPYSWIDPPAEHAGELHLWPHQSLPPKGFVAFIGATFCMILIPVIAMLGSVILWGILPFVLMAVAGVWFALDRSHKNAQILEVLTLSQDRAHLIRHNPKGPDQEWDCNRYWAVPEMHTTGGPVPHYVTLKGEGREVEIGAFLSEDERKALYDDLVHALGRS